MARPNVQCEKVVQYIKNSILSNNFMPGEKLPSENKIAKILNVSRVTVRNALVQLKKEGIIETICGRGAFVSKTRPQTTKKIIPFISQLADGSNTGFFQLYNGIEEGLSAHNLQPLLTISGYNAQKEREIIIDFLNQGYRHMLVLSGFSNENIAFYHSLIQEGVSFVFLDKKPTSIACDSVTSDNFFGGFQIGEHLINLGHKKIAAFFSQSIEAATSLVDRFNGFKLALTLHNLYDPTLIYEMPEIPSEYFAEEVLLKNPEITAVFCSADFTAIPLTNYISRNNLNISVVGFDNLPECETNIPSVTTVEQPFYRIGFEAAKLLHERIIKPNKPYQMVSLPVKLIERESSKPI